MTAAAYLPRHELAVTFTRLLLTVLVVATVGRPLVVELDPAFTWFGAANIALTALVHEVVRRRWVPRWEGELIVALGMVCILPLLVVSGGVNSQFAFLIPLYPLVATMVGGKRLALGVCALWGIIILGCLAGAEHIVDLTGEPLHREKALSRGIWLLLGLVSATGFSTYFQRAYDDLAARLHEQATLDHLTGVANRRALEAFIDSELKRMARGGGFLSLLMVDADRFKTFNDRHGHAAGDRCLAAIAAALEGCTRSGQDLVGRFGGEEFVVVLTDTGPREAAVVAEKLRRAVAQLDPAGTDEAVSVTIGVAGTDGGELPDRDELLRRADRALYEGKRSGRDRVVRFGTSRTVPA